MPCDGANGLLPGRGAPPGRALPGRVDEAAGAAGGVAGRGAGRAPGLIPTGPSLAGVSAGAGSEGAGPDDGVELENGASCPACAGTVPWDAGAGTSAFGASAVGASAADGAWGCLDSVGADACLDVASRGAAGVGDDGPVGAAGAAGAAAAVLAVPASGKAPRSFFTTGASMVDEAERTNSPSSCSFATASFEVIPSSFASSCTRTLATLLLSRSAPSQARTVYFLLQNRTAEAAGKLIAELNELIIVGHSSLGTHRVSISFLTRFQGRTVVC